jgi:CubicO group peptidase (beta-lactamase class C family)
MVGIRRLGVVVACVALFTGSARADGEKSVGTHAMKPAHVAQAVSDDGRGAEPEVIEARTLGAPRAKKLDVHRFGEALHDQINTKVGGYAMGLRKNGELVYSLIWNWSQTPADANDGWTLRRRMHVASISKLFTAMGMAKLLDEKGIPLDASILPYLPKYWKKGPNVGKITFRHLLTNTSGFSTGGSGSDFELMKSKVEAGITSPGTYDYENMNFGLCRILMAVINGDIARDTTFPIPTLIDKYWDSKTIEAYRKYMQKRVFSPAGVEDATFLHGAHHALAYKKPTISTSVGWDSGDMTTMAGGAGWHLSINEVLDVMGAFRRKGTIVNATKAQSALDDRLGLDQIIETSAGRAYTKNGSWRNGSGQQEQCVAYFFPEGIEVVVFVNSPIDGPRAALTQLVRKVYLENLR